MNTYILLRKGKHYIKNDLSSLLLYFDYFSNDIYLPSYFYGKFSKRLAYAFLRFFIIFSFYTKLYLLIYKLTNVSDSALIIINGPGKSPNTIKLVEIKGRLMIIKKTFNKEAYEKEKKFYNMYKDTKSIYLRLPKHTFLKNNIIEIEFLKNKTFQRAVNDGTYTVKESLSHFYKIKKGLSLFYKNFPTLIHGDLFLTNIFIQNDKYFLIDYADSLSENLQYDLYLLLYSLAASYNHTLYRSKTIQKYSIDGKPVESVLGIEEKELLRIEKKYHLFRQKKIPNIYN